MPEPFVVLTTYRPEIWNPRKVGLDLCAITRGNDLKPHPDPIHGPLTTVPWYSDRLHAEVRRRTFKTKQAEGWHYDGDTTPGANPNCAMVLWASNTPTEILYKGEIYVPKPYDVVLFKNLSVQHRRPLDCPRVRWVFRQRVAVPTHIQLP